MQRAEFLLNLLCDVHHCAICEVELISSKSAYDEVVENFVTSYPPGKTLVSEFICLDCDSVEYRCDICYIEGENLCQNCYKKQEEEEKLEESKCVKCGGTAETPFSCDGCGEKICFNCCTECYTCNLFTCPPCKEKGAVCKCSQ